MILVTRQLNQLLLDGPLLQVQPGIMMNLLSLLSLETAGVMINLKILYQSSLVAGGKINKTKILSRSNQLIVGEKLIQ